MGKGMFSQRRNFSSSSEKNQQMFSCVFPRSLLYSRKMTKAFLREEEQNDMNQVYILAGMSLAFEAYHNERTQHPDVRKAALVEDAPYLAHPIAVMALLAEHGGGQDDALLVAALLHDVLENHGGSWRARIAALPEIGPEVLEQVEWVTDSDTPDNKPLVDQRRAHSLSTIARMPLRALALLQADKLNNLQGCLETLRWLTHHKGAEGVKTHLGKFQPGFVRYQHSLTQAIEQRLKTLQPDEPSEPLYLGTISMYEMFVPLAIELDHAAGLTT
jgi:hypothetical protein